MIGTMFANPANMLIVLSLVDLSSTVPLETVCLRPTKRSEFTLNMECLEFAIV